MTRRIGPFEGHIRDAIALNRQRAPLYAALSGGASRGLSRLLIAAEVLMLPVARWFDWKSAPYSAAGVPILDEIFVPMSDAPEFGSVKLANDPALEAVWLDAAFIRRQVHGAFSARAFDGAAAALAGVLRAPDAALPGNDMVRHLLESAHRLATLAPRHIVRSRECGLPSPGPLLRRLFVLHLWGLDAAAMLDRRARPLHLRGVPILAQDLPPIPIPSSSPADA